MSESTRTVQKSMLLNASVERVWQALTDPEITKRYFFACEALSDWQVGSPIHFQADVEGKKVVFVKGVIRAVQVNELLEYTCYAPQFENDPSQHTTATYRLASTPEGTTLTVSQGEFADEETCQHTDVAWDQALAALKTIVES